MRRLATILAALFGHYDYADEQIEQLHSIIKMLRQEHTAERTAHETTRTLLTNAYTYNTVLRTQLRNLSYHESKFWSN